MELMLIILKQFLNLTVPLYSFIFIFIIVFIFIFIQVAIGIMTFKNIIWK